MNYHKSNKNYKGKINRNNFLKNLNFYKIKIMILLNKYLICKKKQDLWKIY